MADTHPDFPILSEAARQAVIARWRRRSRVVIFWRLVLPLAIFAITLSLFGWIVARSVVDKPIIQAIAEANRLMTNPRFYGRDAHERAYLMTALTAIRDAKDQHRITLSTPHFNLGGGTAQANQGIYVEGSPQVVLHGNVVVVNSDGSRMNAQDAVIDTKTGVVSNMHEPHAGGIQLESNMGKISAQDYTIAKNGAVTFNGRVRGVINGK